MFFYRLNLGCLFTVTYSAAATILLGDFRMDFLFPILGNFSTYFSGSSLTGRDRKLLITLSSK